ncbi:MAG: hypothetical protein GQ477_04205 [Nanohaloarchaea archaeon]|nr:hypothetical protein [Candidatus Nanohaloarchaea archaeon]
MLQKIFSDAYKDISGSDIDVSAKFYKYSGVKSSVRVRSGVLEVKVSDALSDAPEKVLSALAYILISRIKRKECPRVHQKVYRLWINSEMMNDRHKELKKVRGRKARHEPVGDAYDLSLMFHEINSNYFSDVLSMPALCWGPRLTTRKYGHYDPSKHAILISKTLDDSRVPRFVAEFVLYHEMLHIIHDVEKTDYQSRAHHKRFRDDEKKFEKYADAEKWLLKLSTVNTLKKKVKKMSFGFFR